jgi:hypothetical protein
MSLRDEVRVAIAEGKTEVVYMNVATVFIIEKNVNKTCAMFYRVMYAGCRPMQRCYDVGHSNIKEPRR